MFGFKKRNYRSSVETELSYLIGFNERYLQKLLKSFDGINDAIENMRSEGETPLGAAAQVWTIIFACEIERSPQLRDDKDRVERYIFEGEGEAKFDTEEAIRTFLLNADMHAKAGQIPAETFKIAVSEVLGALDEVDRNERSARRIHALYDELTSRTDNPRS